MTQRIFSSVKGSRKGKSEYRSGTDSTGDPGANPLPKSEDRRRTLASKDTRKDLHAGGRVSYDMSPPAFSVPGSTYPSISLRSEQLRSLGRSSSW